MRTYLCAPVTAAYATLPRFSHSAGGGRDPSPDIGAPSSSPAAHRQAPATEAQHTHARGNGAQARACCVGAADPSLSVGRGKVIQTALLKLVELTLQQICRTRPPLAVSPQQKGCARHWQRQRRGDAPSKIRMPSSDLLLRCGAGHFQAGQARSVAAGRRRSQRTGPLPAPHAARSRTQREPRVGPAAWRTLWRTPRLAAAAAPPPSLRRRSLQRSCKRSLHCPDGKHGAG